MVCNDCGEELVKAYIRVGEDWLTAWLCGCKVDDYIQSLGEKMEVNVLQEEDIDE